MSHEQIMITLSIHVQVTHIYLPEALISPAPPPKLLKEYDEAVELSRDQETDLWSTKK
jgi:hypothetical protein